ncbi:MAG: hypothetical protein KDB03_18180 [Planctomycetales bacterium]|nr:hypothetical protein [Planctomycetales bacterium]
MSACDLMFLLPGYELDSFPRHLEEDLADDFLSGWIALWHPWLLLKSQAIPKWRQPDNLPNELPQALVMLTKHACGTDVADIETKVRNAGGLPVRARPNWRENQRVLLDRYSEFLSVENVDSQVNIDGGGALSLSWNECPEETLKKYEFAFAALGYAFLQIQLMTRQLRYTSNLDELLFTDQIIRAAECVYRGDLEEAEKLLQSCFDSLGQERDHYYALDVHLLDVTLLADSTLGASLKRQLDLPYTTSLVANAELLLKLFESNRSTWQKLRSSVAARQIAIAGGLVDERPHPLMQIDSMMRDLERGRNEYSKLELDYPHIFARMTMGLDNESAMLLRRFGFRGVLLEAWTEGKYPKGEHSKISWESSDGTFISAIAGPVFDASSAKSFLALGWHVGEALDHEHVPTLVFAHWPGQYSEYFELLQHISSRTPALGKWWLVDDYFESTDQPYHQERLKADEFQFDWLSQTSVPARELIANCKSYVCFHSQITALQNLASLVWQLECQRTRKGDGAVNGGQEGPPEFSGIPCQNWFPELDNLWQQVDALICANSDQDRIDPAELSQEISKLRTIWIERFLNQVSKSWSITNSTGDKVHHGKLIINPHSSPVRVTVHSDKTEHLAANETWHYANGRMGNDWISLVDTPGFGFVHSPLNLDSSVGRAKGQPITDSSGLLMNEFLEAQVDSARGHLRSLHVPGKRGNRLSLMIARREVDSQGKVRISEMQAKDMRLVGSSNVFGMLETKGDLLLEGKNVGRFELDYRLLRGNRHIEIGIKLSGLATIPESSNPWKSAYVLRLAWPNESALLRNYSQHVMQPWSAGRVVAPSLIEIDETDYRTHYLTGGLTFHRRVDRRFLETILAVSGQSEVYHRVAVAVDLPNAPLAAMQWLDKPWHCSLSGNPGQSPEIGWLINVNQKNVRIDLCHPLIDDSGMTIGQRIFISEHGRKQATTKVRFFANLAAAFRVDARGGQLGKLSTEKDTLIISLRPSERTWVDLFWAR